MFPSSYAVIKIENSSPSLDIYPPERCLALRILIAIYFPHFQSLSFNLDHLDSINLFISFLVPNLSSLPKVSTKLPDPKSSAIFRHIPNLSHHKFNNYHPSLLITPDKRLSDVYSKWRYSSPVEDSLVQSFNPSKNRHRKTPLLAFRLNAAICRAKCAHKMVVVHWMPRVALLRIPQMQT